MLLSILVMVGGKIERMKSSSILKLQHRSLNTNDNLVAEKGDVYRDVYDVNDIQANGTMEDDGEKKELKENSAIDTIARSVKEMMNMLRGTYECLMKRINLLKYKLNIVYQDIIKARYRATVVDCSDIKKFSNKSGYYTIYMETEDKRPITVFCDMKTDGGGWTVVQQRRHTYVNVTFNRKWHEYLRGFGSPDTEQFAGLLNIYTWSISRRYEMRVNVRDHGGYSAYANYDRFHIESNLTGYRIMPFVYSGTAGDSLEYYITEDEDEDGSLTYVRHGMRFSTSDNDNDLNNTFNCAKMYEGGWWFSHTCGKSNLNGPHLDYSKRDNGKYGIWWSTFRDSSLYSSSMMIRPRPTEIHTVFDVLVRPIYLDDDGV